MSNVNRPLQTETIALASELYVDILSETLDYSDLTVLQAKTAAERATAIAWTLAAEHTIGRYRFLEGLAAAPEAAELASVEGATFEAAAYAVRKRLDARMKAEAEERAKQAPEECQCEGCQKRRAACDELVTLVKGLPNEATLLEAIEAARKSAGQELLAEMVIPGAGDLTTLLEKIRTPLADAVRRMRETK